MAQDSPMSEQHAEWKARAAECRQAALTAMEHATNVTEKNAKAEFLQVATEMLKLADAIDEQLAADTQRR
jgi:hypothetical protein